MNCTKNGLFFFCAVLLISTYANLVAQAPTDEWRRPGVDAMVAEPGQGASILSNPAGLKTQEERYRLKNHKGFGQKNDWIFDLLTLNTNPTKRTWELFEDPETITAIMQKQISFLERIGNIISGKSSFSDETGLELFQKLSKPGYDKLRVGTSLPDVLPADLTLADFESLGHNDFRTLADNLNDKSDTVLAEFGRILEDSVYNLGDIGGEHFSRFFSFTYANDQETLAWGFYFGFEQKFLYRRSKKLVIPIDFTIDDRNFKSNLPVSFQAYFAVPIRLAFAHEFGLPGFSFGLGLKAVPYIGFNQNDLGHFISDYLQRDSDQGLNILEFLDDPKRFVGINLGIDLGVQYHFGAITPKLEFLHTGLKVSDLVGFNIPFSDKNDPVRYAVDFDWGVYAEQQLAKPIQVFGGVELIQIRGLFKTNPYSALIDPIDHLRLLAGIGLFNNVLRVSLQYYNNTLSPTIMLNAGVFQMNVGLNIDLSESQSFGFDIGFRLRGPHDGFNKKIPYKTYATKKAETIAKKQKQQRNEENQKSIEAAQEVDVAIDPDAEPDSETSTETSAEPDSETGTEPDSETSTETSAEEGIDVPTAEDSSENSVPNVQ